MILLDTSFLVSYFNSKDENHKRALELFKEISELKHGEPAISDYIFDEVATVLLIRIKDLPLVVKICTDLKKIMKFKVSESIFEETWRFFSSQKSTHFSFTDCSSVILLNQEKIRNLATFDNEFSQIKDIGVIK